MEEQTIETVETAAVDTDLGSTELVESPVESYSGDVVGVPAVSGKKEVFGAMAVGGLITGVVILGWKKLAKPALTKGVDFLSGALHKNDPKDDPEEEETDEKEDVKTNDDAGNKNQKNRHKK